ncbi:MULTISPECIES: hypothetical protein [unclassified Rathayibacter]|uniref:hypothetical protein n=1 Tax=unclassified Rathayibacter TaxID=2609250 RepID=UPI0011CDD773|nr:MULTISPECIES: hypothetical protein [unclassified Rathayibacter]
MISNRGQLAARREARKIVRDRAGRVRLLRAELDVQGARSIERTKTVEAKASFIVTAAALVAGASISLLPANPFVIFALVLAAATVFCAAQAAKPLTLEIPSARDLVDEYLHAALTVEELEDTLLEVRTVEIEKRDEVTKTRARAMTLGFRFLVASVITLVVIAALGALPTGGLQTDDEREHPGTTTTEAPRAS